MEISTETEALQPGEIVTSTFYLHGAGRSTGSTALCMVGKLHQNGQRDFFVLESLQKFREMNGVFLLMVQIRHGQTCEMLTTQAQTNLKLARVDLSRRCAWWETGVRWLERSA